MIQSARFEIITNNVCESGIYGNNLSPQALSQSRSQALSQSRSQTHGMVHTLKRGESGDIIPAFKIKLLKLLAGLQ